MAFDWFGLAAAALPTAIQVGGSLLGQKQASDANKDAARTAGQVSGQAANTLKTGYDQQLSALLGVTPELRGNYADRYAGVAGQYQPYAQSGRSALNNLQSVVSADPSQLTPSQELAMRDYRNQAASRLASSGLRGAGRAGVAAVNEGDAKLRAQMFDTNQRRGDAAATELARVGYNATGQQASALNNFFSNNATLSATNAQLQGNTAMDKAKADAAAQGAAGSALVGASQANGQAWGETMGGLGSVIAGELKDRNKSRWAADTSNTINWGPRATTIWDPPNTGNNMITWS